MNTYEAHSDAQTGLTSSAHIDFDDSPKVQKPSLSITTVANKLLLVAEREHANGEAESLIPKLIAEGSKNELQWKRRHLEDDIGLASASISSSVDVEYTSQGAANYHLLPDMNFSQIKSDQSVGALNYEVFMSQGNGSAYSYGCDTSDIHLQHHLNEDQGHLYGPQNDSSLKRLPEFDEGKEVPSKKPKYRPSRPPLLPPCRVCADRASGFHYGVNTCEACKGFFRRSLCKKVPYTCVGDGDCKMVHGKRTACSACRFKRCLEVGMSKDAIKTGRYTHELRSKNILEVKQLQTQLNGQCAEVTLETRMLKDETEDADSLRIIIKTLLDGQKFLHEFLDDYYNDELILERQRKVYQNRYMGEKAAKVKQFPVAPASEVLMEQSRTKESNEYIPCVSSKLNRLDYSPSNEDGNISLSDKGRQDEADDRPEAGKTTENLVHHSDMLEKSQDIYCNNGIDYIGGCSVSETDNLDTRRAQSNPSSHVDQNPSKCETKSHSWNAVSAHVQNTSKVKPEVVEKPLFSEGKKAEVLLQIIKDMERGVHGMLSFAKSLPGFEGLQKEDQIALVKAARFDIWYIGHIRCFNTELRVGACEWEFHEEELMQVWGKDIVELAFVLSRLGQRLDLSIEETAALRAVSLSFPDRCYPLQDRKSVEMIHEHMLKVFKYVSSQRHKNFNSWFTKVIDFLVLLREFGISFEKVSNNLTLDWSILKTNPLLLAVFLS